MKKIIEEKKGRKNLEGRNSQASQAVLSLWKGEKNKAEESL